MSAAAERLRQAEAVLREAGLPEGRVDAEGSNGEIAAVGIPPAQWGRFEGQRGRELSARLRALGFRYVALDLGER